MIGKSSVIQIRNRGLRLYEKNDYRVGTYQYSYFLISSLLVLLPGFSEAKIIQLTRNKILIHFYTLILMIIYFMAELRLM